MGDARRRAAVPRAANAAAAGVDVVIAQGSDAGGHTGVVPTFALVPQVVDAAAAPAVAPLTGRVDRIFIWMVDTLRADKVHVYNPKTVRASAGALFHVPVVEGCDPQEVLGVLGVAVQAHHRHAERKKQRDVEDADHHL